MQSFLEQKGVCLLNGNFSKCPREEHVWEYELGLIRPNLNAPHICLMQNLEGKWNKAIINILTIGFICAVNDGKHRLIEHTWLQMQQKPVKKRFKEKLYSI